MIFGNSDPTFFAMLSRVNARRDQNSLQTLHMEVWAFLSSVFKRLFFSERPKGRAREARTWRPPGLVTPTRPPKLKPVDFELLAGCPVDRANPHVSLKARLLRSRQILPHGRTPVAAAQFWVSPGQAAFAARAAAQAGARELVMTERN